MSISTPSRPFAAIQCTPFRIRNVAKNVNMKFRHTVYLTDAVFSPFYWTEQTSHEIKILESDLSYKNKEGRFLFEGKEFCNIH